MDPRFLPFQIAAGILLAAFIIMMIRVGMQVYRNSSSWRGWAGAAIFGSGLFLGYATVMAGFGH